MALEKNRGILKILSPKMISGIAENGIFRRRKPTSLPHNVKNQLMGSDGQIQISRLSYLILLSENLT